MSAVPTTKSALLRQLRLTTELDVTRQISRVTARETNFEKALGNIAKLALLVSGVSRIELTPGEPLLGLLSERLVFGETSSTDGRGSALASVIAGGTKWGELRVHFELQPPALVSPLRFTRFMAQQIGLTAVYSDLRWRREALKRRASNLQSVVARRKAIHRAKALLTHAHRVSEDEAFLLLRRYSQEAGRTLHQVAEAVIFREHQRVSQQALSFPARQPLRFPIRAEGRRRTGAAIK